MKPQKLIIVLTLFIIGTQLSSNIYSQGDTTMQYLKSYRWLWPKGIALLNERDSIVRVHEKDALVRTQPLESILKKDTIKLFGISSVEYDNIQLSFQRSNGRPSPYEDSVSKYPTIIFTTPNVLLDTFRYQKHNFQLNSRLEATISIDDKGDELQNASYTSIADYDFIYNFKEKVLDLTYDYCLNMGCKNPQKKHLKFKVIILKSKRLALIPI